MSDQKIKVGITQGDVNGIGLELAIKVLSDPQINDICIPVLFSSQKTVGYYKKVLNVDELNLHSIREFSQLNPKKSNLFNCYEEEISIEMGKSTSTGGKYALLSLKKAVEALQKKEIDVLVTLPIDKHNIQSAEFNFPGHTEYFADNFSENKNALMFMCSPDIKIGLVTGHVSLSQVAAQISKEKIVSRIKMMHESLIKDFQIRKPKIAVLGLNPHAGDNGTIGKEELEIIKPAIDEVKDKMMVYGPYSADGFFGSGNYKNFDGVLAMYHDQGLIPFKMYSFGNGVNFTAGLSVIRTSPDHGTAYDKVGKNLADADSVKQAIYRAIDIYRNRNLNQEINANPLAFSKIGRER